MELYYIKVLGFVGSVEVSRYLTAPETGYFLKLPRREARKRAGKWTRKFGKLDSNLYAII